MPQSPTTALRTPEESTARVSGLPGEGSAGRLGIATRRPRLCRDAIIAMVQPADFWCGDDSPGRRRCDRARDRCVLAEGEIRPGRIVGQQFFDFPAVGGGDLRAIQDGTTGFHTQVRQLMKEPLGLWGHAERSETSNDLRRNFRT